MYAEEILLFLIINCQHLFLGYGYFSLFMRQDKQKRILFLTAWGALWAVINILYYYVITDPGYIQIISAVIIGLVLLCSAIIFNLYDKIKEKTDEKIKSVLYQQQLEYYTKQYQEISHNQEKTRKMRHEIKNNFILIEALAKKGDTDSILKYIQQMYQSEPQKTAAHTGNMVVDSVINYKITTCARNHIKFALTLNIPTDLDTNDIRLCGLLGNALDNAIEACLLVPEEKRTITISMEVEKKNLFIEITNPYDGTILSNHKGQLLTRKPNASHHGFGLSIMNELLGNNFGTMETLWDDNLFCLRIILYLVI